MSKVFLGGTCNNSTWRDELIPKLKIDYFNPVVKDWTEECYQRELKEREECDFCLYVITPEMMGVYSIAEAIDDSNKRSEKTVFCFLEKVDGPYMYPLTFGPAQIKSLDKVGEMVKMNGGAYLKSLDEVAEFLNNNKNKSDIPDHDKCIGVRGVKTFKCMKCSNHGSNFMNGVPVCGNCIVKYSICSICGKAK